MLPPPVGPPFGASMNFGMGGGSMMGHPFTATIMPVNAPQRQTVMQMMTRPPHALVGDAGTARVLSSNLAPQSVVEQQVNQVVSFQICNASYMFKLQTAYLYCIS